MAKAIERAVSIRAEVCQVFVKNNMQWLGRPYRPDELESYRRQLAGAGLASVFGHTGYLINIAAPPSPNLERSLQSLIHEIDLATQLGLPFLVLHPGAHLGRGESAGLKQAAASLNAVFRATRQSPVRIALENTAGQGTCLGYRVVHLADIFGAVERPERLGVCLDTAHFFAAGYDLRTAAGWETAIREVEELMGLDQVLAFHLNDSKTELGSRVDRHAGIGAGKIGRQAFAHLVKDPRFDQHPGCLETPKSEDLHEDVENLAMLRRLAKGKAKGKSRP